MASAELWPSSAENILYFGVQKRLRAFLYPIFTGWGVGNKLPQSSLRLCQPPLGWGLWHSGKVSG